VANLNKKRSGLLCNWRSDGINSETAKNGHRPTALPPMCDESVGHLIVVR